MIIHNRLFVLIFMTITLCPVATWAEVTEIAPEQVRSLLESDAVVIDVRREDEWMATGIIENSQTATFFDKFGRFDAQRWLQQVLPRLRKDRPVVLICRTGVRSKWVATWLSENTGFGPVFNATRGIQGWLDQGHSTVAY
ncbi:MAG: rhodanese-like domain-containing protein [Gammaproteobacteria bacterium]|nr:rhodanese-like domain-containing protein [Gammaproteobacteria bacterium]